ncbi:positive regulator of sigma-B activity [Bacillus sp. TS-2]|nr:positive regulator of sigma-B activity [Bacillus sp. TS-2]
MHSYIVSFLGDNKATLLKHWKEEIERVRNEKQLNSISEQVYENMSTEFMQFVLKTIQSEVPHSSENLKKFTEKYIQVGWPLSYFTRGLQTFRRVVLNLLIENEKDVNQVMDSFKHVEDWCDEIIHDLVHEYTGSWEDVFEMQKVSLLELSAPLIPVFEGITVMPLVGTVDTARAKLIMENLLEGVINHRSNVVLIDITGVPVVDTMVAHHIIQASEAVRLVGATCILVGIRPEIAQTIVNLGIDLTKFPTKSSLRKGMETALELNNKKVVDL